MWPGLFALFGIALLVLSAVGVTAGRVSLALLGAACLAIALFWPQLSTLFS
jgi:hypothetical protein